MKRGPQVLTSGGRARSVQAIARQRRARDPAVGQPYTMLRPEHYDIWKDIEFTFDPSDMFR